MKCSDQELRHLLAEAGFIRAHGFMLHSARDGECSLDVPFQEIFERPGGIVSGQVFMAAADVAMWLAIKTKLGMEDASVTVEMKTNFLSNVRKADFRCTAKVLKLGRRLIYGVAESTDANGKLLAHHTLTYIRSES